MGLSQVRKIGLLSRFRIGLGLAFSSVCQTIGAAFYDPRHAFAKAIADIIEPRLAALIFNAIVQKRRDGEVLVTAIL